MPSEKGAANTALPFSSLSVWTYAICGLLGLCLLAMTVGLVFTIQSYLYAKNSVSFGKELALKQLAKRRNLNSNERFRIRFAEQESGRVQDHYAARGHVGPQHLSRGPPGVSDWVWTLCLDVAKEAVPEGTEA